MPCGDGDRSNSRAPGRVDGSLAAGGPLITLRRQPVELGRAGEHVGDSDGVSEETITTRLMWEGTTKKRLRKCLEDAGYSNNRNPLPTNVLNVYRTLLVMD